MGSTSQSVGIRADSASRLFRDCAVIATNHVPIKMKSLFHKSRIYLRRLPSADRSAITHALYEQGNLIRIDLEIRPELAQKPVLLSVIGAADYAYVLYRPISIQHGRNRTEIGVNTRKTCNKQVKCRFSPRLHTQRRFTRAQRVDRQPKIVQPAAESVAGSFVSTGFSVSTTDTRSSASMLASRAAP